MEYSSSFVANVGAYGHEVTARGKLILLHDEAGKIVVAGFDVTTIEENNVTLPQMLCTGSTLENDRLWGEVLRIIANVIHLPREKIGKLDHHGFWDLVEGGVEKYSCNLH